MKHLYFILAAGILAACGQPEEQIEQVTNPQTTEEEIEVTYPEKIYFDSKDGLKICAEIYEKDSTGIPIVLCHQAGFNKIEYVKIAPALNEMGYRCMAIDQRSGGNLLEWFNETKLAAEKDSLPTTFLDAVQDIEAAVDYYAKKTGQPVILWGSSYSSGLVMKVANDNSNVRAVLSFSPGEYFGATYSLRDSIAGLNAPVFVTSSLEEANEDLTQLLSGIDSSKVHQFIPQSKGTHGSRALWKTDPNNEEYWKATTEFLDLVKKKYVLL